METPRLTLMPLVYVADLDKSIAFYSILGGKVSARSRSGTWAELRFGDSILALHQADHPSGSDASAIELCFVSSDALEALQDRLSEAGIRMERPVTDEAFGFSMMVRDPDDLPIQINQHDTDLYT
jgi:predicted lactoylglutathione lyase